MNRRFWLVAVLASLLPVTAYGEDKVPAALNFEMKSLAGKPVNLSKYQGKVVLVVNVASACGATPQYADLQALHKKYADQGLAVLGFPCNEFGEQEPGTDSDIATFCRSNYGVEFDIVRAVARIDDKERVRGGHVGGEAVTAAARCGHHRRSGGIEQVDCVCSTTGLDQERCRAGVGGSRPGGGMADLGDRVGGVAQHGDERCHPRVAQRQRAWSRGS